MKDLSVLIALICAYMSQGVHKTLGGNTLYLLYAHLYELLSQRHIDAFDPDLVESQMNQVGSFLIPLGLWFPDELHVPLWHKLLNFSNSVNVLAQGVLLDSPIGKYLSNVADAFNRYAIMAYNYEVSLIQEKHLWKQVKTHEKNLELRADAATEGAALFAAIEAAEAAKLAAEAAKLQKPLTCITCGKQSGPHNFCGECYIQFRAKANDNPDKCAICNNNKGTNLLPMCKKCRDTLNTTTLRPLDLGQVRCYGSDDKMSCAYGYSGSKVDGADCCQRCNPLKRMVQCKGLDGDLCMHQRQTGEEGKRYAHHPVCSKCNTAAKVIKEWVKDRERLWQQRRQQLRQQKCLAKAVVGSIPE
jgi:hypothetical protein